ncbi:MAG: sulfur carrier protein ThiS [Planctomycetota bacterium]|nr:sulfur carrier protein ThiS [Planctomycetota bacterium]
MMKDLSVQVSLNGLPTEIHGGESLTSLLARLELQHRPVAVEVNGELIPREHHAEHRLVAGDAVEIVTLVGGG